MGLTLLNMTAYLKYQLQGTTVFGSTVVGPANAGSSLVNSQNVDLDTWDELYAGLFIIFPKTSLTGNTTDTSNTIDGISSNSGLAAGMRISGSGIPTNSTISSFNATAIVISNAATATATGVSLTVFGAPIGLSATNTTGGALTANTSYFYVVTATGTQGDGEGETMVSPEATATTTATNLSVDLSWTALNGATGYKIYRGTSSGTWDTLVGTITADYPTAPDAEYTDDGDTESAASPPASQPNSYSEFEVRDRKSVV